MELHELNTISQLLHESNSYTVTYHEFMFPLLFDGETFRNARPAEWRSFSNDGMTYLLYRLGENVDRKQARMLYDTHQYQSFVEYINQAWDYCRSSSLREQDRIRFLAAVIDGSLWGLLTNYHPVPHRDVLSVVQDIAPSLTWSSFSPKEMRLFFGSRKQDATEFGLTVRNGETGHVTLSYRLGVRSDDYMFLFPTEMRRRHLSHVDEVELQEAFEAVKMVAVDNTLLHTPTLKFLPLFLKEGSDDYMDLFAASLHCPIHETIQGILSLRKLPKHKTFGTRLLNHIYQTAYDLYVGEKR